MANKRDYNLDDASGADLTYYIKTDKSGLTEAQKISIGDLKTLLGVTNPTKETVTVTSVGGATLSNIKAERIYVGDMIIYNIEFDYASGGETDPEFILDTSDSGRPFIKIPILCQSEIALSIDNKVSYMIGSAPNRFVIEGTFALATFRMSISIIG